MSDLNSRKNFIHNSKKLHRDAYDYSKVIYINNRTNVIIGCSKHDFFEITPSNHLQGNTCPSCAGEKSLKKRYSKFIKDSIKYHSDTYDYSLIEYKDNYTEVKIICKTHGEFKQIPKVHRNGSGCSKCALDKVKNKLKLTTEQFIEKSKQIHGDLYDYSLVKYNNSKSKIEIVCKKHGSFWQKPNGHLTERGCAKCVKSNSTSKAEIELANFISKLYKISRNNRKVIHPKEIDIFIPSLNFGIEYNGTYWHSEEMRPKGHRGEKTKKALNKGVVLIHIEEKDWKKDKESVKKYILNEIKKVDKNGL